MPFPKLSRRQVFTGTGAAVMSYAVMRNTALSSTLLNVDAIQLLAGVVEQVKSSKTLIIKTHDGQATIELVPAATFSRGHGPVASLSAYLPGDEIVAEGEWNGGTFTATALSTMYRFAEDHIEQRRGDQLSTTADVLHLSPKTIPPVILSPRKNHSMRLQREIILKQPFGLIQRISSML